MLCARAVVPKIWANFGQYVPNFMGQYCPTVLWCLQNFKFYFYFILLCNTVLVLPYIDMNPPRVYISSQSCTPSQLPPHIISLDHPCAPTPSILYLVSNIDWRFVSYMIVYMFQCHFPNHPILSSPSPSQSKSAFLYICVSFAVSHTGSSLPSF